MTDDNFAPHAPRAGDDRAALERRWLALTRRDLPTAAPARGWPVRFDHCFQRILLDNAVGGVWYDAIPARPAYLHAPDDALRRAVALGEAALAGAADLPDLNRRSLAWRRERRSAERGGEDPTAPEPRSG